MLRTSSGNAWAALGMVLVRRAIEHAPFAPQLAMECQNLGSWTREILDGAFQAIVRPPPFARPFIPLS